jgi:hypothetical protein
MRSLRIIINITRLILFGLHSIPVLACSEMWLSPAQPKPGQAITLVCSTKVEVKQIAVVIVGVQWNGSFANLYDDGTHGDQLGKDQQYSLSIDAPPVPGLYQVRFYRILPDQTELLSEPLILNIE